MEAKNWYLHLEILEDGQSKEYCLGHVHCKRPQRTLKYKRLMRLFDTNPNVRGVGYTEHLESVIRLPYNELTVFEEL